MFNRDFFPTPEKVFDRMIENDPIAGKIVYDPEGGKGNIVDYAKAAGAADVISTELNPDLRKILQTKCKVIGEDFLKVESHEISHVQVIIMNPPFSTGVDHILHAYKIAPDGCKIISLCNHATIKNPYSKSRSELVELIKNYGDFVNLGDCFSDAERQTDVEVALIRLQKPGNYDSEFSGFFMEDEREEETGSGIMSYNAVRDLVNRYVECIKIYDSQLDTAVKLNEMRNGYFSGTDLSISVTRASVPVARNEFKKEMQKSGWKWIFSKMNMEKISTKGLKEDINKFVEQQINVPFTMANIYKMLEIVVSTSGQRMDKAVLEVFDRVTERCDDNKMRFEGWKTNSHFLLNRKFIVPNVVGVGWSGEISCPTWSNSNFEMIEDLVKALCYLTGKNYDDMVSLEDFICYPYLLIKDGKYLNDKLYEFNVKIKSNTYKPNSYDSICQKQKDYPGSEIQHNEIEWGKWFDWGFFKCKAYKKGTMHFEFKEEEVWGAFNQRVAKLRGYPLAEKKSKTAYQERNEGFKKPAEKTSNKKRPVIITTINLNKKAA